jgi:large conductance mechanosensitive channel
MYCNSELRFSATLFLIPEAGHPRACFWDREKRNRNPNLRAAAATVTRYGRRHVEGIQGLHPARQCCRFGHRRHRRAAFNAIVTSLVKDVLTQLIAAVVGQPDFSGVVIWIKSTPIHVGNFLNATLSFLIVASVVYFGVVLPLNAFLARVKKPTTAADPTTKTCPECLSEIPLAARRCSHCTQPVV